MMGNDFIVGVILGVVIYTVAFIVIVMVVSSMSAENACMYAHQVEQCESRYVPVIKGE